MGKMEDLISMSRLNELLNRKEEKSKRCTTILWVLAIIGAVAAVAGIAYAVYRFLTPDCDEDLEDEFEDEFDEDFFADDEEAVVDMVPAEDVFAESAAEAAEDVTEE